MLALKLRLQKFLDRFRQDGQVAVSLEEAAYLLETNYKLDNPLLGLLAQQMRKQNEEAAMRAINKAGIPHSHHMFEKTGRRGLYEGIEFNMYRQAQAATSSGPEEATFLLSSSLVQQTVELVYEHQPEQLGLFSVEVLALLDLQSKDFTKLLSQTSNREYRQRLVQATRHLSSNSQTQ